jgi:mRNA interferase RelE/StbE
LAWQIELTETAAKQLAGLDKLEAKRIMIFLRKRLAERDDPRDHGAGPLGSLWRDRVGDNRVICEIQEGALRILVLRIGNCHVI